MVSVGLREDEAAGGDEEVEEVTELQLVLEEARLGRLYSLLRGRGMKSLNDVEGASPGALQDLVPAVGTRRKLLNLLTPGCRAAGTTGIPFRADQFIPRTHVNPAPRTRKKRSTSAERSGTSRQHTAPQHGRSITRSYTHTQQPSGARRSAETGPHTRPARRVFSSTASPDRRRHAARRSPGAPASPDIPPPPPPATESPPTSRNGTRQLPPQEGSPTPLPSPPHPTAGYRQRPAYIPRTPDSLFTFLTSQKIGLPVDRALRLEQLFKRNDVSDVSTLSLLSEEDMERLGVNLGVRRKVQAALGTQLI